MNNSLKFAFLKFVNIHQLITTGQRVLVAVSAGVDSMVLLQLLQSWQSYFRMELGVIHFNHQLRGTEADADAAFVKLVAADLGLPCHTGAGDVRGYARQHRISQEEAGRILRERFFRECRDRAGYDLVATAHHLNDQAETLLLRLLSGTGLEGLAGIRLRREHLIRPLLFASREAIEAYAREQDIAYREDASNRDLRYRRNKIRHQLLPYLAREFNFINLASFLNIGLIVQEMLPEIEKTAATLLPADFSPGVENKIRLDISTYKGYFSWIQIKTLEMVLSELLQEDVKLTNRLFRDFTSWLAQEKFSPRFRLHPRVEVRRSAGELVFEKLKPAAEKITVAVELQPGAVYRNEALGFLLKIDRVERSGVTIAGDRRVEYIDGARVRFPLKLRTWKAGDRFQPLGMRSEKKVSDFLTDEKNLLLPRRQMLVLENTPDIVAVVGSRIDERYKLTEHTQHILKIEIESL